MSKNKHPRPPYPSYNRERKLPNIKHGKSRLPQENFFVNPWSHNDGETVNGRKPKRVLKNNPHPTWLNLYNPSGIKDG